MVLPGGRIVADVTATRQQADLTRIRKTDRCFLSVTGEATGCVLPPTGGSTLRLLGRELVDERTTDGARSLVALDADTLRDRATFDLGLPVEGRVPGGTLRAVEGGFVALANHGLTGVVADGGEQGVYTVEGFGWDAVEPRWRRAVPRWPDEVLWTTDLVLVHANASWTALDPVTGELRWRADGVAGGCVGDGSLWLAGPARLDAIDLVTGQGTSRDDFRPPSWVASCVWLDGGPVFHGGGVGRGDGWLKGPRYEELRVPRVDLELGDHVEGGRLWIHELGRGLVEVDPAAREVGSPVEVHDVVRLGDHLAWYVISADARLRMTLRTGEGRLEQDRRVSPRPWHVDGGDLYTFANIAQRPEELVSVWRLPGLAPR